MIEAAALALVVVGATFLLVAAVGMVRMPDLFTRLQASTKAATLGVGCLLAGVALHFGELGVTTRVVLIITFFLLTVPVGAHMIGRAAYFVGVTLWEGTVVDELRGRYDPRSHRLSSLPADKPARAAADVSGPAPHGPS